MPVLNFMSLLQYNDQAVQCTWEGDNTILALQSGRSLVQSYGDAVKGEKLPGGTAYLNGLPGVLETRCPSDDKVTDADTIERAWACVSANVVKNAADRFDQFVKEGKHKEEALEMCSQERFVAAKIHTSGYIYRQFRAGIEDLRKTEDSNNGVIATLEKICALYGLWAIEDNAGPFLKYKVG